MLWIRRKMPARTAITTVYACGHEQEEAALNLTGRGWCDACQASQLIITASTGWI